MVDDGYFIGVQVFETVYEVVFGGLGDRDDGAAFFNGEWDKRFEVEKFYLLVEFRETVEGGIVKGDHPFDFGEVRDGVVSGEDEVRL